MNNKISRFLLSLIALALAPMVQASMHVHAEGEFQGHYYRVIIDPGVNYEDAADAWNAANRSSVYSRFEFELDEGFDPSVVERLELRMKYDDGYAAYLNGQLVQSTNTPSPTVWNSRATRKRLNLLNTITNVVETTDLSGKQRLALNFYVVYKH